MSWQKEMEKRARKIVEIISDIRNGIKDPKLQHLMTEGHFKDLDEIYSKEMRVAKILDESTITMEMHGDAIDPTYYAEHITSYYKKLVVNSKNICMELLQDKTIETPRFEVMDYARKNELYLGFRSINERFKNSLLLFSKAAYNFEEEHEDAESTFESLQEDIDPALAHEVLTSLTNLGPKRGYINEVKISGAEGKESGILTFRRQQILRKWAKGEDSSTINRSKRTASLEGPVREINWETKTFHILCDKKMIKIIPPYGMNIKDIGNDNRLKVTARRVYYSKDGTPSLIYADGIQNLHTNKNFGQDILF